MFNNVTWQTRSSVRDLQEEIQATDRYVDIGVRLTVVRQDPKGSEVIPGRPLMSIVGTPRVYGGIIDTKATKPAKVRPTENPIDWYCSEDQHALVLHSNSLPRGQIAVGSEGAGKTTCGVMWTYFRWLEHLGEGREGGITAPTETRLGLVLRELMTSFPAHWYTFQSSTGIVTMCDGTRLRAVSTYRQSAAQGSRIQGFNWSWCFRDEMQDQIDVHADIESRGRAAKDGGEFYKQLGTATAKDDSEWRNLRDSLVAGGKWTQSRLLIGRSPFVAPNFLETKAASMSAREFRRRYLAEDLAPERATYPAWNREHNLITIPDLGWDDVTAHELKAWGPHFGALVGHDPGSLFDVSVVLKAFQKGGRGRPFWVVVDEVTTEQSTTEQHVDELVGVIRQRHNLNLLDRQGRPSGLRMLVRADPYGNNDARPDRSCYTLFRNAGITIHPAAYSTGSSKPGRVPKNEGIEVVNTLLCNARNERRLFIARKPDGTPCAPNLVKALESSERDLLGKAETQRKDIHDQSHWPAALRYALWAIERPRLKSIAGGLA